jgi:cytochrome c5
MKAAKIVCLMMMVGGATVSAQRGGNPLPPGEGRELVATACSQCHGLATIAAMRDGRPGWKIYVYDMILRGAQLNPREADSVLEYLVKNFGPDSPKPVTATAVALPSGPGKEVVEARCSVCHDLGRVAAVKRQKSDWDVILRDMVARGATITPEDMRTINSYLVAQFGIN